jgi:hypothetical protein
VSFYRPVGLVVSVAGGGTKVFNHGWKACGAIQSCDPDKIFIEMGRTALAVVSLATTLFRFTVGSVALAGIDLCGSLNRVYGAFALGDHGKAAEELFQAARGVLSLAIMATSSCLLIIVSTLLQVVNYLLQARTELNKELHPEAGAKTVLSLIRLHQAKGRLDAYFRPLA